MERWENIDRYFYFEDVKRDDWLWIALMKALYPSEWGRTEMERKRKGDWLARFQASGYQLIDAVKQPINSAFSRSQTVSLINEAAPNLNAEIKKIDPKQIVLVKATVYEALFRKLKDAKLPVVDQPPARMLGFHDSAERAASAAKPAMLDRAL